jgi:hypothetical protein
MRRMTNEKKDHDVAIRLGAALGSGCWPWPGARCAGIGKRTLRGWVRALVAGDSRFVALVDLLDNAWKRWPWL